MGDDALRAARDLAAGIDAAAAAARCGALFEPAEGGGRFVLRFLGEDVGISFPELEFDAGCQLPPHVRALLVYYIARSDGAEPTCVWRSFAALPDARFYARAFQGYTGEALVRRTGGDAAGLPAAIEALGGRALAPEELATNADSAWVIRGLPRVPVALVWWDADEEFPARAELLFDESAPHHLTTDGCAVLGSWTTARLATAVERGRD